MKGLASRGACVKHLNSHAGIVGPPLRRALPAEGQSEASPEGRDSRRDEGGDRPQDSHDFRGEARPSTGGGGVARPANARGREGSKGVDVVQQELRV